jgi:hypothetical protein
MKNLADSLQGYDALGNINAIQDQSVSIKINCLSQYIQEQFDEIKLLLAQLQKDLEEIQHEHP